MGRGWLRRCTPALLIKSLRGSMLRHSGLFRARLRALGAEHWLVLTYHRILPRSEGGRFLEPGMYVEPRTFEAHLQFLRRHFVPCALGDFLAGTRPTADTSRPACLLTFDDGWEDFHRFAFPLLARYQVPATVFLPTAYIGGERRFWTERLADLAERAAQRGELNALATLLGCESASGAAGERFTRLVEHLKGLPEARIEALLGSAEERFGRAAGRRRDFMTWEEVTELRRSGLVSFGSHSDSHRLLSLLTETELERELAASRAQLAAHGCLEEAGPAFCYPNGDVGAAAPERLPQHGYACAFTTRRGWNDAATPRYCLRRVGLHEDVSHTAALLSDRIYFSAAG